MNATTVQNTTKRLVFRIAHLGARTLMGMLTALLAAVLLFLSPEIGILGAVGGVAMGVVSAVLTRPHGGV